MGAIWNASWPGTNLAALDFVVGGIPRGGTTAFADAFNRHPEIYCHASETHLLEFAAQMSGAIPIPAAALPAIRAELRRCLQINLIDLVEFNLQMGSPEPPLRFGEADVDLLADEMASALNSTSCSKRGSKLSVQGEGWGKALGWVVGSLEVLVWHRWDAAAEIS